LQLERRVPFYSVSISTSDLQNFVGSGETPE